MAKLLESTWVTIVSQCCGSKTHGDGNAICLNVEKKGTRSPHKPLAERGAFWIVGVLHKANMANNMEEDLHPERSSSSIILGLCFPWMQQVHEPCLVAQNLYWWNHSRISSGLFIMHMRQETWNIKHHSGMIPNQFKQGCYLQDVSRYWMLWWAFRNKYSLLWKPVTDVCLDKHINVYLGFVLNICVQPTQICMLVYVNNLFWDV